MAIVVLALFFLALFVLEKALPALPHLRLVTFALVTIALGIAVTLTPARARSATLLLASLAFGITLVEAVATAMEHSVPPLSNHVVRAPIVGWDNSPAGICPARRVDADSGKVIYDVAYTIDAHQERLTRSNPSGRSVVFLGDSFTFGEGVNDADTMPQRFADLLGGRQHVVNLGVSGFSPSQVLAELQTGLKDEAIGKNPTAFVMLTGPFHIVRTDCKESWTIPAPRFEKRDGHLVFLGPCAEGLTETLRRFVDSSAAYRVFIKPWRLRPTHGDIETYIDIIDAVARTAKAKYGVETIVPYLGGPVTGPKSLRHAQAKILPVWVYFPDTRDDDDTIVAELKARGVKVVDMTLRDEAMSGRLIGIPGDGHPTPFAHARRAEMTLASMKALGIPLAGLDSAQQMPGATRMVVAKPSP